MTFHQTPNEVESATYKRNKGLTGLSAGSLRESFVCTLWIEFPLKKKKQKKNWFKVDLFIFSCDLEPEIHTKSKYFKEVH